jgi:hypothetical protein
MPLFWVAAAVGVLAVILLALGRLLAHGDAATHTSANDNDAPPRRVVVAYWALTGVFVATPLAAVVVAGFLTHVNVWGVALALLAALWLAIGLAIVAIPLSRGRSEFEVFVSRVEQLSNTSFRSLVRLWMLAIAVAAFAAIRRLALSS